MFLGDQKVRQRAIRHILVMRKVLCSPVLHTAVRPSENDYDKVYHHGKPAQYRFLNFTSTVIPVTLERYLLRRQREVQNPSYLLPIHSMWCFDVYYYLKQSDFSHLRHQDDFVIWFTGGKFHPIPGKYQLPCHEGTYEVYSEDDVLRVSMVTRGQ